MNFFEIMGEMLAQSGFTALTWKNLVMFAISFVLLYMAIKKQYEPLLLLPIAFGMFLANLPDVYKRQTVKRPVALASINAI